jgi:predicted phage baseplate assembly protein
VAIIQALLPEQKLTTITLQSNLKHSYDAATVTIAANVVLATHGETIKEVLGSGDGMQVNQHFALKKPPLTYLPAATASGANSILEVRVDGVLWQEVPSLSDVDGERQSYMVRIADDGQTSVIFGDGINGARLPSGRENVVATYRSGIGLNGHVQAGSLSLLKTKPQGIRSVINPLAATGGVPPETLALARDSAPVAMLTVDRLVSLKDYENFALAFNGIGKAQALALWNGEARVVHITIAGLDGAEIKKDSPEEDSPIYDSLIKAIETIGDPTQQVTAQSYEKRGFQIEANVKVAPQYDTEDVLARVETALEKAFAFENRDFGQAVTSSEIIAIIHNVLGVVAVDLNVLDYYTGPEQPKQLHARLMAEKARLHKTQKDGKPVQELKPAQSLQLESIIIT